MDPTVAFPWMSQGCPELAVGNGELQQGISWGLVSLILKKSHVYFKGDFPRENQGISKQLGSYFITWVVVSDFTNVLKKKSCILIEEPKPQ